MTTSCVVNEDVKRDAGCATAEYLAATEVAALDLVLVHGWGCDREVWRPLLSHLRPWANITLLDVPGCAPGIDVTPAPTRAQVLDDLLALCPPRAVYVGWSLGGQLAVELAQRAPARVAGVVTLCTNPRFVADGDWPGVEPKILAQFAELARAQMPAALRRFHALRRLGCAQTDVARYRLQRSPEDAAPALMAQGLAWLGELDLRESLTQIAVPQLHLLASNDNLVPVALAEALTGCLSATDTAAEVQVLEGVSHLAPVEVPALIASHLRPFLERNALLAAAAVAERDFEKRDVAESFSRAATSYDAAAALQRDVGNALLARLDALDLRADTVLDLGCGTGAFSGALRQRFPDAAHVGLDLAEGMVGYARAQAGQSAQRWVVGDAEMLPLATDSVDLVFSTLAVQWCRRPDLLFAELARVLAPGGRCVFATLGPGTLVELRESWAAVDAHQHVNRFLPGDALRSAVQVLPGVHLALDSEPFVMDYARVKDLLLELKALGAHNVNRRRSAGLTGRAALRGMQQAYEQRRRNGRLPATYDVVFGTLEVA